MRGPTAYTRRRLDRFPAAWVMERSNQQPITQKSFSEILYSSIHAIEKRWQFTVRRLERPMVNRTIARTSQATKRVAAPNLAQSRPLRRVCWAREERIANFAGVA